MSKDRLTSAILRDKKACIQVLLEYRHPNFFIAYLFYKNVWYWGYGADWVAAVKCLVDVLYNGLKPDPEVIPRNPINHIEINRETGVESKEPLNDRKILLHNDTTIITYRNVSYTRISAEIKALKGTLYGSTGSNVFEATKNLMDEINYRNNNGMKY